MIYALHNVRGCMIKSLKYNFYGSYFRSGICKLSSVNLNYLDNRPTRCYSSSLSPATSLFAKYNSTVKVPVRFASNESTSLLHSLYCDTRPVLYIQDVFQTIHDLSGLQWWSSIVLTVIGLRLLVTLPFAIYQYYILAKYENLGPEIEKLSKELIEEVRLASKKYSLDEKRAKYLFKINLKNQTNKLIVRDNCHPFKASLLIYFQIPLFVSQTLSLRNMVYMLPVANLASEMTYVQLSSGGMLWFSNLTCPDTTWILPILMGIVNLCNIEFNTLRLVKPPNRIQRWVTNGFRVLTVVLVPIAASVPSCLTVSWLTSSVYGLIQNVVLQQPKVRRFFRIPKTETERETPLRDVLLKVKQKLKINE